MCCFVHLFPMLEIYNRKINCCIIINAPLSIYVQKFYTLSKQLVASFVPVSKRLSGYRIVAVPAVSPCWHQKAQEMTLTEVYHKNGLKKILKNQICMICSLSFSASSHAIRAFLFKMRNLKLCRF